MGAARLTVDLDAVAANWAALQRRAGAPAAATVKADGYGLGAAAIARRLAREGCRTFFVALAEEGAALRQALGDGPEILVFSGHMAGDAGLLRDLRLTPVINSAAQLQRQIEALPGHPFAIQLDTGMNRLGMEPAEWAAVRDQALAAGPRLILSHLACADEPDHRMNRRQLEAFRALTEGCGVSRSLAATGGVLLGPAFAFDLVRPGIGLYGAAPYREGRRAVQLDLPVIQCRTVEAGESVGYAATWVARRPTRAATVAAGYADGLSRALSGRGRLWAGAVPCPILGRVSMDLIVADISALGDDPETLAVLGPQQGPDDLAASAGTIGYEVLTGLGARLARCYTGARG
jgi:alanine racemase